MAAHGALITWGWRVKAYVTLCVIRVCRKAFANR